MTLPIVLTCDDHYVKYASVLIASILANAQPHCRYEINILSEEISPAHQTLLRKQVALRDNVALSFVFLEDFDGSRFHLNQGTYQTVSTWYRLYIPELFPQYDRILYLDCDMVADDDLSPLATIDFEGRAALVIRDHHICSVIASGGDDTYRTDYYYGVLGMKRADDYFNAGVVCFNLEKIRREGIGETFFQTLARIGKPTQQDQDVLNATFASVGGVKHIDPRYNFMGRLTRVDIVKQWLRNRLLGRPRIAIYHYAWANKAWHRDEMKKGLLYFDRKSFFYKYLLGRYTPREFRQEIIETNGTHISPFERILARYIL